MEPTTFSHRIRTEWMRTRNRALGRWLLLAPALLLAASPSRVSAQVIPGLVVRSDVSVYATFPTNLTPNFAPFDAPVLFGYSLGGFYQSRHIWGGEIRGSIQRRVNAQHQESALIGPRAAVHFGRITPYTCLLFGAGNGWRFAEPPTPGERVPKPVEGMGFQWTLAGGVDLHLSRYLAVRAGELSYSELSLKRWDLTPVNVTAGVILRLR